MVAGHGWPAISAGVHEKMTWFWHGVVPVSHSKVYWWQVEWPAHKLVLRQYALGNYRSFLKKMTVTPAMLLYLDGSWSTVQGPNENYARELQELFTIGQEHVTETNVQHAALALAGWHADYDTGKAVFIDERWASLGSDQKVSVLGKQVYRADGVVDAVCDQSATARFIANKAWLYLVGRKPSSDHARQPGPEVPQRRPGQQGRSSRRSCTTRSSCRAGSSRPRYPVEWVIAAMAAMGLDEQADDARHPLGHGPGAVLSAQRGRLAHRRPLGEPEPGPRQGRPRGRLAGHQDRRGRLRPGRGGAQAVLHLRGQQPDAPGAQPCRQRPDLSHRKADRARILLALCLSSPEFCLA